MIHESQAIHELSGLDRLHGEIHRKGFDNLELLVSVLKSYFTQLMADS
jgi:hypothetical protein